MKNLAYQQYTALALFDGSSVVMFLSLLLGLFLSLFMYEVSAQGVHVEAERLELDQKREEPLYQLTLTLTQARLSPCSALKGWLWLEAERVVWRRPLEDPSQATPQEGAWLELESPRLHLSPLVNLPLPPLTLAPDQLWRSLTPPQIAWRRGALFVQQGLTLPLPSALGGDEGAWVRPSLGWWRGPLASLKLSGEGEFLSTWSVRYGGFLSASLTKQHTKQHTEQESSQWGVWAVGELTSPPTNSPTNSPMLMPLEAWGRWHLQRGARLDLGGRARLSQTAHVSAQLALQQPASLGISGALAVDPLITSSLISARLGGLSTHLTLDAAHLHAPSLHAPSLDDTERGGLRLRGVHEQSRMIGPFTLRAQSEASSRASATLGASRAQQEGLTHQHHLWASLSAHVRGERRVAGQYKHIRAHVSLELSEVWRERDDVALWGALPPHFMRLGLKVTHLWRLKRFELSVGAWVGAWRDGFFNSQDHTRNNTHNNTPHLITLSAPSHIAGELEVHLKRYNAPLPFSAELTIGSARLTSFTSAPQAPHLSWSFSAGESLTLAWWGASEGGAPWALWGVSALTPIQPLSTPSLTPSPTSPFGLSSLKQALTLAFNDPTAPLNASLSLWSEGLALVALDWSSPCGCWGARLEGGVWHKAWTLNSSTAHDSPESQERQERRVGLSLRLGP